MLKIHGALATTPFDNNGPVDVPTVLTSEFAQDCFVTTVEITNTNSVASGFIRVVSAYGGDGAPLIPPHALNPTEVITYTSRGRRVKQGVSWQSDGPGCTGYIAGYL